MPARASRRRSDRSEALIEVCPQTPCLSCEGACLTVPARALASSETKGMQDALIWSGFYSGLRVTQAWHARCDFETCHSRTCCDFAELAQCAFLVEDTRMQPVISISNLSKTYASGFRALKDINLEIRRGEIFALLGPNGAGKTTLISIVCGIVNPTGGQVTVGGHDIIKDFRPARSLIGLVPQELTTDAFESVWATVCFTRG